MRNQKYKYSLAVKVDLSEGIFDHSYSFKNCKEKMSYI